MPISPAILIGHGFDIHRIEPGGRLVLGGIVVAEDRHPIAHSDGDVAIHALVDAMLGAMGWGDIGDRFPDTDARFRGADSTLFLESVVFDVRAAGYEISNADLTILAERPRIKPFRQAMMDHLSRRLSAPVNVKAGTHEGCDAVGQGLAIAAHAVVLLRAQS
jgi:2-C-methyl-D-erythritol 2,4-cyclodiphosphate synthase